MKRVGMGLALSLLCAAPVSAGLVTTNSGNLGLSSGDISSVVEAKVRLNKNSGSGFLVTFLPGGPNAGSGSAYNGYFQDALDAPFTFTYDRDTGASTLSITRADGTKPLSISKTMLPAAGLNLVGLRLSGTAVSDGSSVLANMALATDQGDESLSDFTAAGGFTQTDYFFEKQVSALTLMGRFHFDWGSLGFGGQESYRLAFTPLQADLPNGYDFQAVPEPSTLVLAGLGGVSALGYRVVRRRRLRRI